MVSSPDDANISDLGSILPNLGKLSIDDADDSLGLGGTSPTDFCQPNDQVDSSSGQQGIEPINEEWLERVYGGNSKPHVCYYTLPPSPACDAAHLQQAHV
jgi:hypothetical protein